jgi:hypothetical protein
LSGPRVGCRHEVVGFIFDQKVTTEAKNCIKKRFLAPLFDHGGPLKTRRFLTMSEIFDMSGIRELSHGFWAPETQGH